MKRLAPNGRVSNLTTEQWKLVRTPAFKKWFGDWENSPETASKVVDENGEPLVVNHTYETENAPNVFQKSKEVYINGKYKRIFENDDIYEKLKGIYGTTIIDGVEYNVVSDYWEFWFTNKIFGGSNESTYISCFLNIRNLHIIENSSGGQGSFGNMKSDYDGISGVKIINADNQKGTDYYIVLFSTQIKLADGSNTTFDGSNPDIRFDDGGSVDFKDESKTDVDYLTHRFSYKSRINIDRLGDVEYLLQFIKSTNPTLYYYPKEDYEKEFQGRYLWEHKLYDKNLKNKLRQEYSPREWDFDYGNEEYKRDERVDWSEFDYDWENSVKERIKTISKILLKANSRGGLFGYRGISVSNLSDIDFNNIGHSFGYKHSHTTSSKGIDVDLKAWIPFDSINIEATIERNVAYGELENEIVLKRNAEIKLTKFDVEKDVFGVVITKQDALFVKSIKRKLPMVAYSGQYRHGHEKELKNGGTTMRKPKNFNKGGLIAPNGKPSNLTPEQYRLVRTPAFKKWFGDWENSPETASKVVDENGEPLVVYHGSPYGTLFNVFDGSDRGNWFGEDIKIAQQYRDKYIEDWEQQKSNNEINDNEFKDRMNERRLFTIFLKAKKIYDLSLFDAQSEQTTEEFNKIFPVNLEWKGYKGVKTLHWELFQENYDIIKKWLLKNKYDCIKIKERGHITYNVFNPTQIKLADGTNTKFDGSNPDIRFGKGGGFDSKFEYTLSNPYKNVFLLEMPSQYDLASTFAKCQAFYEWDEFKGKKFKIDDYYKWFSKEYPELKTYQEEFYGFNLPSDVIDECYKVNDERTEYDNFFLKIISEIKEKHDDFYIIGAVTGDKNTIDHEIAHSFFWRFRMYKNKMKQLVDELPNRDKFFSILSEERGYGKNVLYDEVQAFMSTGLIVNISEWEQYREPFIKQFNKQKDLVSSVKQDDVSGDIQSVPEGAKLLPLTKGKYAIVDEEDFDSLNQWKWRLGVDRSRDGRIVNYYGQRTVYLGGKTPNTKAQTKGGKRYQQVITLGKQIMGIPTNRDLRVDHIDGNKLNAQKSNLRIASVSQINYGATSAKDKSKLSSKYIGVSHKVVRGNNYWRVSVKSGDIEKDVVFPFTDEGELRAAHRYDVFAKKYHGEFANTNFKDNYEYQKAFQKMKLDNLSSEEREKYNEMQRIRAKRKRESMTPEEKEEYNERINVYRKNKLESMTPEEREKYNEKIRERYLKRNPEKSKEYYENLKKRKLESMTPEEREEYERRKNITPEEREKRRKERVKSYSKTKYESMTPEEKFEIRKNIYIKKYGSLDKMYELDERKRKRAEDKIKQLAKKEERKRKIEEDEKIRLAKKEEREIKQQEKLKPFIGEGDIYIHEWLGEVRMYEYGEKYSLVFVPNPEGKHPIIKRVQTRMLTKKDESSPKLNRGGSVLLAPNGKPSNLNETQYRLVRTPAFKKWFGDWERKLLQNITPSNRLVGDQQLIKALVYLITTKNDQEFIKEYVGFRKYHNIVTDIDTLVNKGSESVLIELKKLVDKFDDVSKIVDENGEPLVMYHGTRTKKKINIFKHDVEKRTDKGFHGEELFYFTPRKTYADGYAWRETGTSGKVYACFLNVRNPYITTENKSKKDKKNDGSMIYHKESGMITHYGKLYEVGVEESNQIKLADGSNTTFDGSNPDIRYADGGEIEDVKNYLQNVTFDEKYYKENPDVNLQQYRANFGRDGAIHWEVNPDENGQISGGIYIYSIIRNSGNDSSKKGSRGEGAMAIASLFLRYPMVTYLFYEDESMFEDKTSFWERIGGSPEISAKLQRKDFFKYFENKFGYNPDIRFSGGGEMKLGDVMTGKGWSYSNVIKFKVGNRADKFDKLVVGNYYVHPIHKRYTDSYEYQVMKFIGFEERKRSMYAATYSKSEKPVLTAIFKSDDSVNTSDYSVPKYQFKDFEIYECEIITDKKKLGGVVDYELIKKLNDVNAKEKMFSNEEMTNTIIKSVLDNENFIQRNKKYAAQNKIMQQKQIDFVNGQGMDSIRKKLIQKNTEESIAVADLISIELANIRAKQFDYKTEEGKAKSQEQYDIKNELIEKLYKQYQKNNWEVKYEPSTIPNISHTLFFTLPNSDIQMSYHGNFENISDIEKLPKGKWDGIAGATFHKLEEKSADILGEKIEDTHWRNGVDLGFTFTQRYPNQLSQSEKEKIKTNQSVAETYERFLNIPEEKLNQEQKNFINFVNEILNPNNQLPEKLSIPEIENLIGKKLHWWNDDVIEIKGNKYKKIYLQPYYRLVN